MLHYFMAAVRFKTLRKLGTKSYESKLWSVLLEDTAYIDLVSLREKLVFVVAVVDLLKTE